MLAWPSWRWTWAGLVALLEQERGEGVAQAVRREVQRELGVFQDALERLVGIGGVEGRAALGAEHPGRERGPPAAQRLGLPLDLEAEERPRELLAHVHRPAVPALGRVEPTAREPASDPDLARAEVQVLPLERFAQPEAGTRHRDVHVHAAGAP